MKLLITGCRGFVGRSIGNFAAKLGHEVLGLGLASQPSIDWPGNYRQCDVAHSDFSDIIKATKPDMLFHAAGTASVGASLSGPFDDLRGTILPWANTLECVRKSGTNPLVIFPSSAAVYGNPLFLPVDERAELNPISPYGYHKRACEIIAQEYTNCFGLNIVVCRFFSIFGELQRRLLVWELYQQFIGDQSVVWINGTGDESRDYLYIEDAARAILDLTDRLTDELTEGHVLFVNLAGGMEIDVITLATKIKSIISSEKEIRCRGLSSKGDPYRWHADISVLRTLLPEWAPAQVESSLSKCIGFWDRDCSYK